jgi:HD superfamily phosphohydrolase
MSGYILACLRDGYTEPVRDSLWGHIYLTAELKALTDLAPFMRLQRIMQLGPAFRVYPGATHTRASHSIGVYHLARRLLTSLAEKGADSWLSREGVYSFLCAALLHDLGHFPYTHSLKELPLETHEALTAGIIRNEPLKSTVAAAGADPGFTAAIVDSALAGPGTEGMELRFYRKLLSGVLDPDKLDYLNRDARYCGVPYGAQDVDFVLSRLRPSAEQGVEIDGRGIPSVESVLFSKYLMYRAVYWHKSVRSATAMIKKTLLRAMEDRVIAGEDLYDLDDQGLFALMENRRIRDGSAMAGMVRTGRLYETAVEFSFDEKRHYGLKDITRRSELEESLAAELSRRLGRAISPGQIIIDIPEPVSFESDLFVADEGCYFGESSSAFKKETVDAFVRSLRIVRVFVEPDLYEKIRNTGKNVLQITEKWVEFIR